MPDRLFITDKMKIINENGMKKSFTAIEISEIKYKITGFDAADFSTEPLAIIIPMYVGVAACKNALCASTVCRALSRQL